MDDPDSVPNVPARKKTPCAPNYQLRWERELRGWSQATVAKQIGAQPNLVSRWENGYAIPSPYYREKLCYLFTKDAHELGMLKPRQPIER